MRSDDPTVEVDSAHAAIVQAETLLRVGRSGLGRSRPADFWDVQAVQPLAALLFAASPLGNGQGGPDLPPLKAEFNEAPHVRGTVSMARTMEHETRPHPTAAPPCPAHRR